MSNINDFVIENGVLKGYEDAVTTVIKRKVKRKATPLGHRGLRKANS